MKKYLSKIVLLLQIIAAFVALGAIYIWAPVCNGLLTLANGNMAHMRCYYTAQSSSVLALVLVFAAIIAYLSSNDHRKVQWITVLLGIMLIANTIESGIGSGMCQKAEMACQATAMWIKYAGILAIVSGLLDIGLNSPNPNK